MLNTRLLVEPLLSVNYRSRLHTMSRQGFVLAPCGPDDLDPMIDVYLSAFKDDYFGSHCFPAAKIPIDGWRQWLTRRFSRFLSQPEIRVFKVTELSTGKVAAWARWTFPYKFSDEEKAERGREEQEKEKARAEGTLQEYPPGANLEACHIKFGELSRLVKKHVNGEEMYMLGLLCTDPAYQKKGLGSLLLNNVIALADAEGRKVYLESTVTGHPVYLKFGFRDIDLLSMDLSKWGGEEPGVNTIMLREPQPVGKQI